MKQARSVLCVLLAAGILASSAGCSKGANSTNGTAKDNPASAQPSSNATGPWDKYKPVDLQGRTITLAYNWQHSPATTADKLDPKKATTGEIKDLANMKRIEKKYNCKIKYINIPYDQLYKKLTTSVMAGSPCADLINIAAGMVLSAAQANMIQDLDTIVPANSDMFKEQLILHPDKFMGKTYAMSTYDVGTAGAFIGFNRSIIKKLGVEAPDQLYKEGKWTWDAFEQIAKAATKDTDGDGKIDQWGFGGIPYCAVGQFLASDGGYLLDEPNKKSMLNSPKTIETLDFMNKIYNIDKVAYVKSMTSNWWGDGGGDAWKNNGNIAMFYCELYMIPSNPKLKFAVGCVPTPKGPSDTEGKGWFRCDGGVVIPKGVKDPTTVYEIYEELSDAWNNDFKGRDKDAKKWLQTSFSSEDDVNMCMKNSKQCYRIDNYNALSEYSLNNCLDAVLKNGKTAAQAVKQYQQVSQAKVTASYK